MGGRGKEREKDLIRGDETVVGVVEKMGVRAVTKLGLPGAVSANVTHS